MQNDDFINGGMQRDFLETTEGEQGDSGFNAAQAKQDFLGGAAVQQMETMKQPHSLVPDLSLIPEQGVPGEARPDTPIGVTCFQRGTKILDFVTVAHTGNLQDAVHLTVKKAIEELSPQLVITEGHATYRGDDESNSIIDNRNEIIEDTKGEVEKVQQNNGIQDENTYIPEAGYAAFIAREHGIPSIGGEPVGKELFEGMKACVNPMEPRGYPPEAIIADAFMRQVQKISLAERLAMTEEDFMQNLAPRLLTEANRRVDPLHTVDIPPLTLDQFKEWYALHPLSGNRRLIDVDIEDFVPRQNGSYPQVMACHSGVVRDQHLVTLIADVLNQEGVDTVLVPYGLDHINSLRSVLEDKGMFGTPGTFTRLVEEYPLS